MKTKKVKATDGTVYTEYAPENAADIEKLNEMLRAGKIAPPIEYPPGAGSLDKKLAR